MSELDKTLRDLFSASDKATELAEAFCASSIRKKFLVATYRCYRGCPLAYVYNTPKGVIVHQTAYKLSPKVNAETSSESGRQKNTRDGNRRWKAQSYFLDQAANLVLDCDHLRQEIIERSDIEAVLKTRRKTVTIGH